MSGLPATPTFPLFGPLPLARFVVAWLVLLAVAGAFELTLGLRLPLPEFAALIPDDSYFYLQVAREFVAHGRFAFGPADETYGFQPLWQLVCIALAWLFRDPGDLLYACLALTIVLRVATGLALFACARAMWGTAAGVVSSAVWSLNPAIATWSWGLKENTLYALCLVLALHALLAMLRRGATPARAPYLGLLLGLAVFTRVNAAASAAVLLAVLAVVPSRTPGDGLWPRVRAAALAGATALAVLAPWYVFAWWHFGTAMPTSGVWKVKIGQAMVQQVWQMGWWSFEHMARGAREGAAYLSRTLAHGFGACEFALGGGAAAALVASAWPGLRGRPWSAGRGTWWVASALAVVTCLAAWSNAMVLLPFLDFARWYTVPEYVAFALAFGAVWARAAALLRHRAGVVACAVLLALASVLWPAARRAASTSFAGALPRDVLARAPSATQTMEFGLWLARHVPDHVTLAMFDPGALAYFSGKRAVSLDPLMNSLAYQERDVADVVGYCRRLGIDYVVGSALRQGDGFVLRGLPPESHDVVWVPYPEHPLPWGQPVFAALARLRGATRPDFVQPEILPHGLFRPSEAPAARRIAAAAVPALLRADAVRLRLAEPAASGRWTLLAGDQVVAETTSDALGWAFFDLRPWRSQQLTLRWNGRGELPLLQEAYAVDCTFPPR